MEIRCNNLARVISTAILGASTLSHGRIDMHTHIHTFSYDTSHTNNVRHACTHAEEPTAHATACIASPKANASV